MFENPKNSGELSRRGFLKGVVGVSASILTGEAHAQEKIGNLSELTDEEAFARGMDPKVLDYADVLIDATDASRSTHESLGSLFVFLKSPNL